MALKENYKDDILDTSQNVKRKYQMETNGDGTVSFTDVTEYTQQGDSFGSGDINATNGKVNTIDSAVATLNANLDGFKFYPTGTQIVGLIADDSAYTDANGKYVIWGTATANQLVEDNPNTYKSVPSTEDCRGEAGADTGTPFKGKLEDIDPNRTRFLSFAYSLYKDPYNPAVTRSKYVCKGYKKISVASGQIIQANAQYFESYSFIRFYDENNTVLSTYKITSNIPANVYTNWIDIPNGTYYVYIQLRMENSCYSYLSLLA